MANLTLLDIAKLNGNDAVVGLIEENLTYAPEARMFPMRTIRNTNYTTVVRTALPTTGFRSANEGFAPSKSAFRKDMFECFIFGGSIQFDKAVALAHEDGPEAVKALEASGVMKSALIELGKQIWYGIAEDAKGFPGLKAFTPFGSELVLSATGTAAGAASSVYAVKFGPQDVQLIGGRGEAFGLGEWLEQMINDSEGKPYRAYTNSLEGWIGLQTGNAYCVGRICNLTADSGKGMTDALTAQLLDKFPVGVVPDVLFMSRRSRSQLRSSRTATTLAALGGQRRLSDGMDVAVPMPTESHGIRIEVTDSIRNDDAIES